MNSRVGNKIFIDSTGAIITGSVKVAYVLFTPDSAEDELVLRETASGADCFYIRGATAKQTALYRMPEVPLTFTNGIYVQTLTAGAKVVLVTTSTGG